jgi:hypothetical protein
LAKNSNVVRYKQPLNINIGFVVFFIIIVYVAFNIFSYVTSETVAEYEVSQGTIVSNNVYRGLVLRQEQVVYATQDGYINYYVKNGSRVAVGDTVYSLDTVGTIAGEITSAGSQGTLLSDEALSSIWDELYSFSNSYNANRFNEVSSLKSDLDSEMTQIINSLALDSLNEKVLNAEANNTFYRYSAGEPGLVVYSVDGYEDCRVEDFSPDWMDASSYNKQNLESNASITAQSPVYKLVESENWNIVIAISDELADSLRDGSYIKIRFCKDDFENTPSYTILDTSEGSFLVLSLRTGMVRYINDRFLEIELVMNEQTGLKIPKSAITSKEFFTIPKEYFTQGGDSTDYGLLVAHNSENEQSVDFITPTIYYETDDDYYIDSEYVSATDTILKPDSTTTYIVGSKTDSLSGVYNINKGYAVFKQITIIYENDEYAIVEPKTSYGIALYDHIALDGSQLQEDQLIKK